MIREFTVDPPFAHQGGDVYAREGFTIRQIRNGAIVDTRTTVGTVLTAQVHVGDSQVTTFFEEMGPVTKTVTNVGVGAGTEVVFTFSDGNQRAVGSHALGVELANEFDADAAMAERALIAKAYRHSPDGTDIDAIIGSTITVDSYAETPIQFNLSQAVQS